MAEETTQVLTDITGALAQTEQEAKERPAALVVVGGDINGTLFDLSAKEITFGRGPDNTYCIEFQGISRNHFKLTATAHASFLITDLGSRNGTYLNNKKIEATTELMKGDIIKIGNMAFKYIPPGDPERLTYDKLNFEANSDGLTQCYNKTYFNHAIDLEVKKSKVTGNPLSLIMFDLDHFKHLNDTYGHDAGDYTLKEMAKIIRQNGVRENDIFARYGGEEFVILLPKTNLKSAFAIAERIRALVEKSAFVYGKDRLPVTCSVGVADYRQGVLTGVDLFKRADEAVYVSKKGGRNRTNFYRAS